MSLNTNKGNRIVDQENPQYNPSYSYSLYNYYNFYSLENNYGSNNNYVNFNNICSINLNNADNSFIPNKNYPNNMNNTYNNVNIDSDSNNTNYLHSYANNQLYSNSIDPYNKPTSHHHKNDNIASINNYINANIANKSIYNNNNDYGNFQIYLNNPNSCFNHNNKASSYYDNSSLINSANISNYNFNMLNNQIRINNNNYSCDSSNKPYINNNFLSYQNMIENNNTNNSFTVNPHLYNINNNINDKTHLHNDNSSNINNTALKNKDNKYLINFTNDNKLIKNIKNKKHSILRKNNSTSDTNCSSNVTNSNNYNSKINKYSINIFNYTSNNNKFSSIKALLSNSNPFNLINKVKGTCKLQQLINNAPESELISLFNLFSKEIIEKETSKLSSINDINYTNGCLSSNIKHNIIRNEDNNVYTEYDNKDTFNYKKKSNSVVNNSVKDIIAKMNIDQYDIYFNFKKQDESEELNDDKYFINSSIEEDSNIKTNKNNNSDFNNRSKDDSNINDQDNFENNYKSNKIMQSLEDFDKNKEKNENIIDNYINSNNSNDIDIDSHDNNTQDNLLSNNINKQIKHNMKLKNSPYKYFFHKITNYALQHLLKLFPISKIDIIMGFFTFPGMMLKLSRHKHGYKSVITLIDKLHYNKCEKEIKSLIIIITSNILDLIRYESSVHVIQRILYRYKLDDFTIIDDFFSNLLNNYDKICNSDLSYSIAIHILHIFLLKNQKNYNKKKSIESQEKNTHLNNISYYSPVIKYKDFFINKIISSLVEIISSNNGSIIIFKFLNLFAYNDCMLVLDVLLSDLNFFFINNNNNKDNIYITNLMNFIIEKLIICTNYKKINIGKTSNTKSDTVSYNILSILIIDILFLVPKPQILLY